jgi:hypothetical protein
MPTVIAEDDFVMADMLEDVGFSESGDSKRQGLGLVRRLMQQVGGHSDGHPNEYPEVLRRVSAGLGGASVPADPEATRDRAKATGSKRFFHPM